VIDDEEQKHELHDDRSESEQNAEFGVWIAKEGTDGEQYRHDVRELNKVRERVVATTEHESNFDRRIASSGSDYCFHTVHCPFGVLIVRADHDVF
jgi:hypothetical protein